jgi:hypothetical protein
MSPSDARAQAEAESRFFAHLAAFAVGTAALLGVNLALGGALWAAWVGVGWMVVLTSHAAAVFGHVLGAEWVERRAAALRGAATGRALDALEHRLAVVEHAVGPSPTAEVEDPFDLDAAQAVGRPVPPEWAGTPRDAAFEDDPLAAARTPVDTPRLGGPASD